MAGKRRADPALLKNRVLNSLTRLADRDTLAVAAKELNRAITSVAAEDLGIIVACLVDDASSSPKPIARAEVLRLFELVATTQGEHALYYLPRMLTACTRRFRDIDTAVQDACVDAIGALAHFAVRCRPGVHLGNVNVMAGPEAMGPLFVRPLLDAVGDCNSRGPQDVACRALARVFRRCGPGVGGACVPVGVNWYNGDPGAGRGSSGGPGKLGVRLIRHLESKTFHAAPGLIRAIWSLFAAAAPAMAPQLPEILGIPKDADGEGGRAGAFADARLLSQFESEDWHARKETADALVALMYHMGPTMDIAIEDVPLMGHISRALSAAKFDKVKPARDAVAEATAVARELTTYEGPKHDVLLLLRL